MYRIMWYFVYTKWYKLFFTRSSQKTTDSVDAVNQLGIWSNLPVPCTNNLSFLLSSNITTTKLPCLNSSLCGELSLSLPLRRIFDKKHAVWMLPAKWIYGFIMNPIPAVFSWNMAVLFEMAPTVSVNFISLVTPCVGLREEPRTAYSMSFTWVSHISASMLMGHWNSTQSIIYMTGSEKTAYLAILWYCRSGIFCINSRLHHRILDKHRKI